MFDNQYVAFEEKATLFDSGGKILFESQNTVFEAYIDILLTVGKAVFDNQLVVMFVFDATMLRLLI